MTLRLRILLGIAIAVVALSFLLQPLYDSARDPSEESLADTLDAASAPRALSPIGELPRSPTRFLWTSDVHATRYRFELRGPNGALLHEAVLSETTLVLPRGIVDWNIVGGAAWRVTALRQDGREAARAPVSFAIVSP